MRSVPEWVGANDDQAVPTRVRLRIWERGIGHCEECGRKIFAGEMWHTDHRKPIMFGGMHRENNLRVVCLWCHRSKTRAEQGRKAKSDRVRAKHVGIKKPRTMTRWRKFSGEIVYAGRER
jgi:5-methylcytosine-specific restriction enzyme A